MSFAPVNHLAIIPDGNRRWAKQHGVTGEKKVYELGSDKTFEIIKAAFEADVPYLTFWGSSYTTLVSRPKALVAGIEALFARKFHELATHPLIHEHEVKVEVIGEWRTILKPKTVDAMVESMRATAHYTKRRLVVLIGYDGQRERGAAVEDMLQNVKVTAGDVANPMDGEALLRQHAWTGHLPDVDLIIRTGSWQDPHNSAGFLSLLTSDSQYNFPEVLWPDFNTQQLNAILDDFADRERRLGK